MKKTTQLLAAGLLLCVLLAGCSQPPSGAAAFIAPAQYGGDTIIPDPSPISQTPTAATTPTSNTVFTADAQWEIRDGWLMHEEFFFPIPPAWQDNFAFRQSSKTVLDEMVRTFDFLYLSETGDELCLMRVECYPTALAEELHIAQSREAALPDKSGTRTYLLGVHLETIPEEATYTGECVAIAGALMEDSGFTLRV